MRALAFILLLVLGLDAPAQLTFRNPGFVATLAAPASGGGSFDPITSLSSVTNLLYLETTRVSSPPSDGASFSNWPNYGPTSSLFATQSTSGLMPTWVSIGRNGLPTVRFDGSDDYLSFTAPGITGAQPRSFVAVVSTRTLTSYRGIFSLAGTTPGQKDGFQLYTSGTGGIQDTYGADGVQAFGTVGTNWMVFCYTYDGTTSRLYTNNVEAGTATETLNAVDGSGFLSRVHDGYYSQMDLGAFAIYRGVFSGSDRTNLFNDLAGASRWNIP